MVKITADSTCDLSARILAETDITITPLTIVSDGKEYRDGVDITPALLFKLTDSEGKPCKTSAINVYEYERVFERFSKDYEAVIHINIGSEFSTCHQNTALAASNFTNVYAFDSRNLSSGSGYLVYDAALMAKDGLSAPEIIKRLEAEIPLISTSFILDRLDYMYKGGRCTGFEMFGAKIFNIKPCIEVVNGMMGVGKKYRGGLERVLEKYVADKLSPAQNGAEGVKKDIKLDKKRIFITHTVTDKNIIDEVRGYIKQYAEFDEVIETDAGCTVANHCGPNTLGIIFKLE